ncbi:hypothetical protein BO78DRAFT_446727 [Aspergillus sclerotiicarbonarius CBS 121057]|uniref:Uncharacterized protein n=1 Tax=Aspergillus sclerotiicarbonarius (strain CBS 121057 / IBT 28362) TaxID=1448318 RepID=A0A319EQ75_ASPSB|nr:hypothetical protein BO78DRAFT_446727 [Aspergillus sclerotiicarbonarius CBS 121057]
MSSEKLTYSRESVISHLGGDESDFITLREHLTALLLEHDKMCHSGITREGRAQQKTFILSHLHKLPPYVRDYNPRQLKGLMGLVCMIKRDYKAKERLRSYNSRTSQSLQSNGEGNVGLEEEQTDETATANNITTKPEREPTEPVYGDSVVAAKSLALRDNIGATYTNNNTVDTVASEHEGSIVVAPHDDIEMMSLTTLSTVGSSHKGFLDAVEKQPLPNDVKIVSATTTFNTREPVEPGHEGLLHTVEEQTPPNDVKMMPNTADAFEPIQPNPHISKMVAKARKTQMPTDHFEEFGLNLLARNIWVVNETDPSRHGLCAIQELRIGLYQPNNEIPCLTDLNFIDWLLTTKEQCGYDETIHRLEYRSASTISPLVLGEPMTIPIISLRQWRGALNAQLRDDPDKDPVFYLIYKCELIVRVLVG